MNVAIRPKSGPINRPSLMAALCASAAWTWWPESETGVVQTTMAAVLLIVAAASGSKAVRSLLRDYRLRRDIRRASQVSTQHGSAREALWEEVRAAHMHQPTAGRFVGLREAKYPVFARPPFSLIEASPGAGKTVNYVIPSILHTARLGPSLFIPDVKAELAPMLVEGLRRAGYEVWCINPTNAHAAICGDVEINLYQPVLDAIRATDVFRRDAIKLALDLADLHLPEKTGGDDKNLYFRNGSRRCIVIIIVSQALLEPSRCTPADVFALLNDPKHFHERLVFLRFEIDKMLPYDGIAAFLKGEAGNLLDRAANNPENFASFIEGATQTLLSFSQGGRLAGYGRKATARIAELRERQVICFVISPLSHAREFTPVVSLLNLALLEAAKRYPSGHPVHIVGEEFLNYRFNDIVSEMETLRGLKVSGDFFIQSYSGLVRKYGREAAASIESYADVRIYAGINSFDRAKHVSEMLADATVREADPSFGIEATDVRMSSREKGRRLMTPDEVLAMPRSDAWVFVRGMRPMRLRMAHYGQIAPWRDWVADNPLEGTRLRSDPVFKIVYVDGNPSAMRVEGISYPRSGGRKVERRSVTPVRLRHMIWTIPFSVFWLTVATLGTPHLRYSYTRYDTASYGQCDYVGLHSRRIYPPDRTCPVIAFFLSEPKGERP